MNSSLFKPFQFKSLDLRNRFVMAPMTRTQSPGGIPTQAVADYYGRRAAGDVRSRPRPRARWWSARPRRTIPTSPIFTGAALDGWKKVIDAVHKNHGQMGPQIWHVGKVPPMDPSTKHAAPQEGPDSMSLDDIEKTIAAFGRAAGDAQRLGFDCVELHGAHGYLIDQFFWTKTNARTDSYGGATIKERNRFAVEAIKAVRRAVGPDFAVIIRLSQWKQQDFAAKIARDPQEMEQWLLPLVEAGVDVIHCSQRRFWEPEFEGSDLNFAGWAKKITGQPTITVGSVGLSGDLMSAFKGRSSDPQKLDEAVRRLERGDFDLVAVGRALLQDPLWVEKIKGGKDGELAPFTAASFAKYY